MSAASRMRTWWRAVWRGEELDREMQAELEHHIASYAEDLERGGMERDEAERRARAELGSVAARKEDCRRAWGARMWDELGADVRYAVRMLRKSPGFTAIAVGSLALGIGANTVIFTLAKHVLLDRLDVARPEELRLLWNADTGKRMARGLWGFNTDAPGGGSMTSSFSYPVYQQLRRENRVFDDLFAFKPFSDITAVVDGQAEQVTADVGDFCQAATTPEQISLVNSIIMGNPVTATSLSTVDVQFNPDRSNFQSVNAGNYYLAANSTFHKSGTASISQRLQTELQSKTTYAPVSIAPFAHVTGQMTLSPQAQRYTGGAPDLGYYYDALDYTVADMILDGGTLTVLPGTAIGCRFDYGYDDAYGDYFYTFIVQLFFKCLKRKENKY